MLCVFKSTKFSSIYFLPILVLLNLRTGIVIAADNNELFIYPSRLGDFVETKEIKEAMNSIRSLPTTKSAEIIDIDPSVLRGLTANIRLPDQDASVLTFDKNSILPSAHQNGDYIWYGSIPSNPGSAVFAVHDNEITGTIRDDGALFKIEPIGGGHHAIIKVDESKFPKDHPPAFDDIEKKNNPLVTPAGTNNYNYDLAIDKATNGITNIDILVGYTDAANVASRNNIKQTIKLAIAETNQIYLNSGVNIIASLADYIKVNYSEKEKNYQQVLNDFIHMDNVKKAREESGADLVVLLINKNDYCGLASAILTDKDQAYAAVHVNCATGYYSFAHEIAHLMGARHDYEHDSNNMPFSYGHGFRKMLPTPGWRTVMAYDCEPSCTRKPYFSNPKIMIDGIATGTIETSDNARVLNETANKISSFMHRKIGLPEM